MKEQTASACLSHCRRPLIKHTYLPTVTPPPPPPPTPHSVLTVLHFLQCPAASTQLKKMLSADAASRRSKLRLLSYPTERPLLVCGPGQRPACVIRWAGQSGRLQQHKSQTFDWCVCLFPYYLLLQLSIYCISEYGSQAHIVTLVKVSNMRGGCPSL